jgi:hypothetical protein
MRDTEETGHAKPKGIIDRVWGVISPKPASAASTAPGSPAFLGTDAEAVFTPGPLFTEGRAVAAPPTPPRKPEFIGPALIDSPAAEPMAAPLVAPSAPAVSPAAKPAATKPAESPALGTPKSASDFAFPKTTNTALNPTSENYVEQTAIAVNKARLNNNFKGDYYKFVRFMMDNYIKVYNGSHASADHVPNINKYDYRESDNVLYSDFLKRAKAPENASKSLVPIMDEAVFKSVLENTAPERRSPFRPETIAKFIDIYRKRYGADLAAANEKLKAKARAEAAKAADGAADDGLVETPEKKPTTRARVAAKAKDKDAPRRATEVDDDVVGAYELAALRAERERIQREAQAAVEASKKRMAERPK